MKLAHLLFVCAALQAAVSCSSDSDSVPKESLTTFTDIEMQLEMKGSFSELSKTNILNYYKTTDNFLNLALKRKEELSNKKKIKSHKTQKTMAAYTIFVYDPYYNDDPFSFWCWDDEYIADRYTNYEGRQNFDCDGVGMSPACAARLIEGRVDQSDQSFLDDDQQEAGWVLPCRAYPIMNCGLRLRQEHLLY